MATKPSKHEQRLAKEAERKARVQQEPEPALEPGTARSRLSTFPELAALGVRASRRHVDRMELAGKFPKRLALSAGRIGWITDEIVAWVDARIAARVMQPGKLGSGFTRVMPPPRTSGRKRKQPQHVAAEA